MAGEPAWGQSSFPQVGAAPPSTSAAEAGQLLTIEQVAEFLGVSTKTVRRLMQRGLPSVRFGRLVRFEPRDLLRWVEARKEA
jgi:excisionase family DNA binding protein